MPVPRLFGLGNVAVSPGVTGSELFVVAGELAEQIELPGVGCIYKGECKSELVAEVRLAWR